MPLSRWARRIATIPLAGIGPAESAACAWDMRPSVGAADAFPWARWRRIVGWPDPLAGDAPPADIAYALPAGHWDALLGPLETREAIAAWLRRSRAVRCQPEQILVAGSVQQMLALLARLLIEPGQRLLVEDPSYVGFHAAFLAEGAALAGMPVDAHGVQVEALPTHEYASGAAGPRLAIVTPSHQYPTGVTLSLERRVVLLEWARRVGVVVVEDDYDGDLRLEGQPLEALRGLDDHDEVIYLGTFAKALYPAVRLGFAVLPHWLIEPVAGARAASDRHPAWRDAMAVARFIEAGELERHLARMRRLYRRRRDALVTALREHLGDLVAIGPADAVFTCWRGCPLASTMWRSSQRRTAAASPACRSARTIRAPRSLVCCWDSVECPKRGWPRACGSWRRWCVARSLRRRWHTRYNAKERGAWRHPRGESERMDVRPEHNEPEPPERATIRGTAAGGQSRRHRRSMRPPRRPFRPAGTPARHSAPYVPYIAEQRAAAAGSESRQASTPSADTLPRSAQAGRKRPRDARRARPFWRCSRSSRWRARCCCRS